MGRKNIGHVMMFNTGDKFTFSGEIFIKHQESMTNPADIDTMKLACDPHATTIQKLRAILCFAEHIERTAPDEH